MLDCIGMHYDAVSDNELADHISSLDPATLASKTFMVDTFSGPGFEKLIELQCRVIGSPLVADNACGDTDASLEDSIHTALLAQGLLAHSLTSFSACWTVLKVLQQRILLKFHQSMLSLQGLFFCWD